MVLAVFLLGSGVFASTDVGQEIIGKKDSAVEGEDNTLLLNLDLADFDMDFKIEKIEEDDAYYYVTYTFLDLIQKDKAWQYEMMERTRKISKRIDKDLGIYIAEELSEQYADRVRDLTTEQEKARATGETKRLEVEKYGGLIGETLDVVTRVFPDYQPLSVNEIPSPSVPPTVLFEKTSESETSVHDNLTDVYIDYMATKDIDSDGVFNSDDNCSDISNSSQSDFDNDGLGDVCDSDFTEPDDADNDEDESVNQGAGEDDVDSNENTIDEEVANEADVDKKDIEMNNDEDVIVEESPADEGVVEILDESETAE